jgi:hypothetical protein
LHVQANLMWLINFQIFSLRVIKWNWV